MEGLTQKRTAILKDTESSREGLHFVQVLLELTTGSTRLKPQIREAFHTWLCSVFCFVWHFFGGFLVLGVFLKEIGTLFTVWRDIYLLTLVESKYSAWSEALIRRVLKWAGNLSAFSSSSQHCLHSLFTRLIIFSPCIQLLLHDSSYVVICNVACMCLKT